MAYSGQQLDKGVLRNYLTKGEKKFNKKAHHKKNRQESRNINNENPIYNKYRGGWAV